MKFSKALLHLARRSIEANIRDHLSYPMKVTLNITDKCNSRCLTCNIWQLKAKDELTSEEWRAFFRKSNRISWLDMIGGEIFLRKDFFEIADAALTSCRNLFLFHFVTNALCSNTVEVAERIFSKHAPPLTLITVSLDGPPELNDRIRGVPGNFDKSVNVFQAFRRRNSGRFRVFLGMTLSGHNVRAFPETLEAVRDRIPDIRPDEFHLNIAQLASYYVNDNDPAMKLAEAAEIEAAFQDYRARVGRSGLSPISHLESEYQRLGREFARTRRCPSPCRSMDVSCFIQPRGIVHPCLMWDRPVGGLREHDYDLKSVWTSAEARAVRAQIASENCPHCWTPCEAYQTIIANTLRAPRDAASRTSIPA